MHVLSLTILILLANLVNKEIYLTTKSGIFLSDNNKSFVIPNAEDVCK